MKWICSLTSTIRPRARLLRGAVGRTPNFSEVSAQVLRSTPQSSQKYRAKFSEVSNQVLRTWGQYREYTQNPHNNKKKQVLRTHGQSSQNPRPKFSELAGKVPKEVGDVVQNFANRRGRVIFQVAGAVARCTELNLLADATTEIKWWNWNKIEVESHEKLRKRAVPETQKIKFFKKHPAQVLRSRSPVQVYLRAWPNLLILIQLKSINRYVLGGGRRRSGWGRT